LLLLTTSLSFGVVDTNQLAIHLTPEEEMSQDPVKLLGAISKKWVLGTSRYPELDPKVIYKKDVLWLEFLNKDVNGGKKVLCFIYDRHPNNPNDLGVVVAALNTAKLKSKPIDFAEDLRGELNCTTPVITEDVLLNKEITYLQKEALCNAIKNRMGLMFSPNDCTQEFLSIDIINVDTKDLISYYSDVFPTECDVIYDKKGSIISLLPFRPAYE